MTSRVDATLPFEWYVDPDVLKREQERIFKRRWQYVGHVGQVREPGSVAVGHAGATPVLVTRDQAGELRAFLNVCRHRGTQLVAEDGVRSLIQCPYHGWTYSLEGQLRSAPRSKGEPGFDPEGLGLVPLSLDRWGPFVFVNPRPGAEPLSETLGELPQLVASAGIAVDDLVFHQRTPSRYAANWKVCTENFLECYHCQIAHPGLAKVLNVSADTYRLEEARWFTSQFGPLRPDWRSEFDPVGEVPHGQFHFVYPNLTINIAPGRPNLSIGPIIPDGAGHTRRFLDYFFAPGTPASWIEELLAWDTEVGSEDTALVERVQRGVGSGMLDHGVLLGCERLIAHFDRLVMEDLG